jgi:type III pantothenate kinase
MLLAADIGNTNTVAGVFSGDLLIAQWRLSTNSERMADEYGTLLSTLFALAGIERSSVEGAVIASVVPAAEARFCEAIRKYWRVETLIVSPRLDLGIEVLYSPPEAVGADRIANAVAAVQRYGAPAIVVDFGTGTNFDVVDPQGRYAGGSIAPGIEISLGALVAHAARLQLVPLEAPEHALGRNTIDAVQSGVIFGYAGLVDGLVGRIDEELGGGSQVIATGGLAEIVAPHTKSVQHVDLDLTLVGLRLLYERNSTRA